MSAMARNECDVLRNPQGKRENPAPGLFRQRYFTMRA